MYYESLLQCTVVSRFCALGPSPSKSALNQTVLQIEPSLCSDVEGSSAGKVTYQNVSKKCCRYHACLHDIVAWGLCDSFCEFLIKNNQSKWSVKNLLLSVQAAPTCKRHYVSNGPCQIETCQFIPPKSPADRGRVERTQSKLILRKQRTRKQNGL